MDSPPAMWAPGSIYVNLVMVKKKPWILAHEFGHAANQQIDSFNLMFCKNLDGSTISKKEAVDAMYNLENQASAWADQALAQVGLNWSSPNPYPRESIYQTIRIIKQNGFTEPQQAIDFFVQTYYS